MKIGEKARKLDKNNFGDALHVVLAEKSNVDKLITRNIKDFLELTDSLEISLPESF